MNNDIPHFPPRRILLATDLGPATDAALSWVRLLAGLFHSEVEVLHVQSIELPPYFTPDQEELLLKEWRKARAAAESQIARQAEKALGLRPKVHVAEGRPAEAILKAAESSNCGLIVLGTHARSGLSRLWLGSVAESLLRQSRRPVLVVPASSPLARPKRVLSVKGSAASAYASALAEAAGARHWALDVPCERLPAAVAAEPPDLAVLANEPASEEVARSLRLPVLLIPPKKDA